MEPYLKKLRHYAGNLSLLSAYYGSSEGWIRAKASVIQPLGLTESRSEKNTESSGLYRYRLGDVVKVVGFHNSTPELKFICRSNLLLTINIDKNTEKDLQLSVESASKLLSDEKMELVDFTSHVDMTTEPGHYVIFWEISGPGGGDGCEELRECCNCMDRPFVDTGYMSSRKVGVRKGASQKVLDYYLGLGSAVSQFKTPRCISPNNRVVLEILCNEAVESYFSAAY